VDKTKPTDLRLHADISAALALELKDIEAEINTLRQARSKVQKLARKALQVGRAAHAAEERIDSPTPIKTAHASANAEAARREASRIIERVQDVRGNNSVLARALRDRDTDLWVTRRDTAYL